MGVSEEEKETSRETQQRGKRSEQRGQRGWNYETDLAL